MIKHLIPILVLALTAQAQTVRYCNAGSSGGDGTTTALSGANAAYSSLQAAITGEDATTGALEIYCAGATKDTGATVIEQGAWSSLLIDGQDEFVLESTVYEISLDVRGAQNLTIRNLKIGRAGTGGLQAGALTVFGFDAAFSASSINGFLLENVELYDVSDLTSPDGTGNGLLHVGAAVSGDEIILRNVYVHGAKHQNNLKFNTEGGETFRLHNVTVVGSLVGYGVFDEHGNSQAHTVEMINVLSVDNFLDDFYQQSTPTNSRINTTNASSDATSPNAALRNVTVTFATAPTLAAGDTDVIDQGTTIGAFAYDIFGTARPQGSAWDIGAHELESSSAVNILPLLTEVWGY